MTYVSENFWHDAVNKATTDLFTFGYKHIIKPHFVFNQTPDVAHDQMIQFCKITKNIPPLMWACREMLNYSDPVLETSVMGVDFVNPFGLSAGLDVIEAQGGVEAIAARERALAERFLAGVRDIPGIALYGAFDQPVRSAIVSLNVGDIDSAEVSDALMQGWGIAARPGAHCAPLMHRALGTERQGVVRFSFGYFNTDEEVDTAIDALHDLAC